MANYVVCGLSNRAIDMYVKPLTTIYASMHQVVGVLDADPKRFGALAHTLPQLAHIPKYGEHDFDRMIDETKPDAVLVVGRDDTHVTYILKALARDLDVMTEKPMVTTARDARRVMEAELASKGKVTVTFNYRYSPIHRKIKELILEGKVGRVTHIDLNWYIDTYHGSSYFRRWNRMRELSGGLSIHKSTHHFDLVNWWIDQRPVEAFAYGALNYYGPEGELNPKREDGRHCETCDVKQDCTYVTRWQSRSQTELPPDDHLKGSKLPIDERFTTYRPDMCIYDSAVTIEDTYTCTVRYDRGALLSYSVNFSLPYEGYRLAINGTKGRIETTEYHSPDRCPFPVPEQTIEYFPLFGSKEIIHVVKNKGGHGGGDPLLLEDMFLGVDPKRPYEILAGADAGAQSIAVGEAVWRSVKEGRPITVAELLRTEAEREAAAGSAGPAEKKLTD